MIKKTLNQSDSNISNYLRYYLDFLWENRVKIYIVTLVKKVGIFW